MNITAAQVKELRERTGAGMMECKKALQECNGNIEAAIEQMRKMGQAKAAKKSTRTAAEGVVGIAVSGEGRTAFMVEINTETDFAANNEAFRQFVQKVLIRGLDNRVTDLPSLLVLPIDVEGELVIAQACEALIAKLGENIQIRRVTLMQSEHHIGTYCHNNKIGVLVELSVSNHELGKDIAMHIAASRPEAIRPEDLPASLIAKEKEIYMAQVIQSGKPQDIAEKMLVGRMQKFVNEICLLGQPFVKDPSITIGDLLKKNNAQVYSFVYFKVGEGVEKEEKDFANEVMAQVQSKK